jgi:hypothetical protein
MKGLDVFKYLGINAKRSVESFIDKYDIFPSSLCKKYYVIKYKYDKKTDSVYGVSKKSFSYTRSTPEKAIEKAKIYIKEQEAKARLKYSQVRSGDD